MLPFNKRIDKSCCPLGYLVSSYSLKNAFLSTLIGFTFINSRQRVAYMRHLTKLSLGKCITAKFNNTTICIQENEFQMAFEKSLQFCKPYCA